MKRLIRFSWLILLGPIAAVIMMPVILALWAIARLTFSIVDAWERSK